jgi:hypothetical protein
MGNGEMVVRRNDSGYPFRVFISHKVSGHGKAAKKIKRELENYSPDKLKIFVSPALSPGVAWNPRVLEEIEAADLFIMLYLVRGIEMDWCLYEAGYFEREALKTTRKLICVTNPGSELPGPLEARQRIEAEEAGIEQLLRAIFADEKKPVRPDLFDRDNIDTLNRLIRFVLQQLGPVKKIALTPRLWITIAGDEQIQGLKNGELPEEIRLEGESEALREFGVGPGAGVTLKEFYELSEFKRTLDYYMPHVANALRRVIEKKIDLWRIPPVKVTKNKSPKVLVPAYYQQGQDNSHTFEFQVYEPLPNYVLGKESAFADLYNLFVVAWHFRWRIVDEWLERLMDLRSRGSWVTESEIRRQIRKFRLDFGSILLETLNRGLDSPRKILLLFSLEEGNLLSTIMQPEDGLWTRHMFELNQGIKDQDLNEIIAALEKMKDLNKTILVLTLKRLHELALEKDGEVLELLAP